MDKFVEKNPNIFENSDDFHGDIPLNQLKKKVSHNVGIMLLNQYEVAGAEEYIIQHINTYGAPNHRRGL
jgi:hypothetical protein